ncbi:PRC-barrel domain-containing protein [Rhizobium sp. SL42]|uniref:PRC-barrel domain-containing protein n=1 Tax=Rhizobium sp. SL42 TaxID=2806346 RepID=UPI001F2E7A32|nr:PRC-barrel domain-containing protein [Rhizobium sp. SL42]UJW76237.1 PRC-barrel domain-containing protein [Rhizobium sp. SL42]
MNKSFKTFAAAMLLGSTAIAPFAVAQDATAPAAGTESTTGAPPAAAPIAPDAATGTDATGTTATTAQTTTGTATGETYLTAQSESQMSANDFMGQAIYTGDNQSIGDINDLLVEKDGGIVAAVVGVGGFLGIGEKDVAVPFSKITLTREAGENGAEGDVRLTTTETAESLRNAPEFKTLDDQAADASATAPATMPADNTTTSSTKN